MSAIDELKEDSKWAESWNHVWPKLKLFILRKQQDFAALHPDNFEEVGRFVSHTNNLFKDLESIQPQVEKMNQPKPERPKLHNRDQNGTHPRTPSQPIAPHAQSSRPKSST